ncbi:uncharacterized protein LOC131162585 [Malania oleifera]|uniref:uncharacterized protein LOC131162585 n=1 Tax=Malania oleifera TaxID=397392 RepID=UPI0025AE738D|nr:uncharacterized protein LOC131162585 [Malania oleifera]
MTPNDVENAGNVVIGTIYSLSYNVIVLFDSGAIHSFISQEFVKWCGVEAQPLEIELCVDMPSGIDWLASNFVSIDSCRKEVVFMRLGEQEFLFIGSCVRSAPRILSGMQVRQLVLEGCRGYLANVKESPKKGLKLEDIPMIREFSNVFPEDLPRLPPDRELEFAIELASRMAPISKASYKMALAELKELKE